MEHFGYKLEKRRFQNREMPMKLNPSWPSMTKKRPSPPLSHQHGEVHQVPGQNTSQHFLNIVGTLIQSIYWYSLWAQILDKWGKPKALCYRFPPCTAAHTGVSLLERGTTLSLLALFQYFWQEWMTNYRMSLWNAHNVNIRNNNHLEGWHNQLNNKAVGNKLGFNKLLLLLLLEQDVMETLMPSS
ncbi:hypothetical protein T03_7771, partial [Trichinella britovi]